MGTPIPENQAVFTLADVLEATGGALLSGGPGTGPFAGVTSDTRAAVEGKLFVALRGESFDGHSFLAAAGQKGARGALVEHAPTGGFPGAVIAVRDTLGALGALGALHRRRWNGEVVGIGGSAGKTTTRAAVSRLLERLLGARLHSTRGNLNNRVGVPMVLFGVTEAHTTCVLELGTNQRGEVAELVRVSAPDVAVLTLVALEHSQGLGTLDDIEQEEGDLFARMSPGGVAIANGDDPRARRQLERAPARTRLTYGTRAGSDYRVVARHPSGVGATRLMIEARGRTLALECGLLGEPGALAAAAALAVAETVCGRALEPAEVERALAGADVGEPGRLVPVRLASGTLVLDDTYNANPASVRSSVAVAGELARSLDARLILVIGEMRELGELSRAEHEELGRELAASGASRIVAISGDAQYLARAAQGAGGRAVFAPDASAALDAVVADLLPGDVILVKASRGVRAERVVEGLRAREEARP